MRFFIFLTDEGTTLEPNGQEIENLQVLGTAIGEDAKTALKNLVAECDYLLESDFKEAIVMELVDEGRLHLTLEG